MVTGRKPGGTSHPMRNPHGGRSWWASCESPVSFVHGVDAMLLVGARMAVAGVVLSLLFLPWRPPRPSSRTRPASAAHQSRLTTWPPGQWPGRPRLTRLPTAVSSPRTRARDRTRRRTADHSCRPAGPSLPHLSVSDAIPARGPLARTGHPGQRAAGELTRAQAVTLRASLSRAWRTAAAPAWRRCRAAHAVTTASGHPNVQA
jgi:hypothetical protein